MRPKRHLLALIGLCLVNFFTCPVKALTSSYNSSSQKLVIEGVTLNQDFSISNSDLEEIINDVANNLNSESKSFRVRFAFSSSVEAQIQEQIKASKDTNGTSPSLEISKNSDLRSYRTRVKLARVKKNEKSFGSLVFINPRSTVEFTTNTEYNFNLHDFSEVKSNEDIIFEFEISTAETFSGDINFKVTLNSVPTNASSNGSSVDNSDGGSSTALSQNFTTSLGNYSTNIRTSFNNINKDFICSPAEQADQVNICDTNTLRDFQTTLLNTNVALRNIKTDTNSLAQTIKTARQSKLITKKEAKKLIKNLKRNNIKINKARKNIIRLDQKISARLRRDKTFDTNKTNQFFQNEINQAKVKINNAYLQLRTNVINPLFIQNLISEEVRMQYDVSISEL